MVTIVGHIIDPGFLMITYSFLTFIMVDLVGGWILLLTRLIWDSLYAAETLVETSFPFLSWLPCYWFHTKSITNYRQYHILSPLMACVVTDINRSIFNISPILNIQLQFVSVNVYLKRSRFQYLIYLFPTRVYGYSNGFVQNPKTNFMAKKSFFFIHPELGIYAGNHVRTNI